MSGDSIGPLIVAVTSINPNFDPNGDRKMKIVKALLEVGADINAQDKRGHTALYYVEGEARTGHEWQRKGFQLLEQFLKANGAIKV